jgi:hypothetical protein
MNREFESVMRDKTDIKIFVLFLLDNINYPLDYTTINNLIIENGYVGPFDFAEAFSELTEAGHILGETVDGEQYYMISESGTRLAKELHNTIVESAKNAGLKSAAKLLSLEKSGAKISVTCDEREDKKYELTLKIIDRSGELFSLKMRLSSMAQAEKMRKRFEEAPEKIYLSVMASFTGEIDYLLG